MKAKHIITGVLFITIGLISCKKDHVDANPRVSNQVIMHTIGQDNLYGGSSEGFIEENHVINDSIAWNNLKTQMDAANDVTYKFNEQVIDFSQWTVIVSFDKVEMTGGHSINYSSIVENQANIVATIEQVHPEGPATTVITQPYIVVKIDKTNKPILFN
jgi:hypothetical protein